MGDFHFYKSNFCNMMSLLLLKYEFGVILQHCIMVTFASYTLMCKSLRSPSDLLFQQCFNDHVYSFLSLYLYTTRKYRNYVRSIIKQGRNQTKQLYTVGLSVKYLKYPSLTLGSNWADEMKFTSLILLCITTGLKLPFACLSCIRLYFVCVLSIRVYLVRV